MVVARSVTLLLLLCAAAVAVATEAPPATEKVKSADNSTFTERPKSGSADSYKSSSYYDEQGMHHLYYITLKFLSVVMDKKLADVFVKEEFINAPLDFMWQQKWELFEQYKLFIVLAFLGLLLAVLMPLVGLIICCCRCRKRQDTVDSKSNSWKRGILGLLMFILVVSMLFAIVCAFVTNERTVSGVHNVPSQLNNSVLDIAMYLNNTQEDAEYLLVNNYEELTDKLDRELDHVGDTMRLYFSKATDAFSISDLLNLVERVENITSLLAEIKTSSEYLQRKGSDLASKMSQEQTTLNNTIHQCQESVCKAILNSPEFQSLSARKYDQLPTREVDDLKHHVEVLMQKDIAGKIRTGVDDLNALNQTFQSQVDKVGGDIKSNIREVGKKLKASAQTYKYPIDTSEIHRAVRGATQWIDYGNEYIGYYRYAGIALGCIVTLIFLLYSLGLMWGACSSHTGPCSSRTGASLFLWGVAVFFLTYVIVQLPITAMYILGTIVQRAGCDVAYEPASNTTQSLLQMVSLEFKFNEPLVRFTAKSIDRCRYDNWSLYRLLQEAEKDKVKIGDVTLRAVDFTMVQNYKKDQKLDEMVNKLADQLEQSTLNLQLLSPEARKMVEELKNISFSTVNVQKYLKTIEGSPTLTDIGKFSYRLHDAANAVQGQDPQTATKLTESAKRLGDYQKNLVPEITKEVATLRSQLHELDKMVVINGSPLVTVISDTYSRVLDAANTIQNEGKQKVREMGEQLVSELINLIDEYIHHVEYQVKHVIGRCRPVSTAYDGSVNSICKGIVLPFNGYWVSIGWCLIAGIPTMILALLMVPLLRSLDPSVIPPSESDYISDTAYSERDTIPLAQVHRKARRSGGGRGVYDNRNGYLHDYSPEYRDHHPQRSVTGITSPSVAYVPAPHYNYTRDPDLPPYKPTHGPTAPPVHDWGSGGGHGGSDYHKPPPYYFPGP